LTTEIRYLPVAAPAKTRSRDVLAQWRATVGPAPGRRYFSGKATALDDVRLARSVSRHGASDFRTRKRRMGQYRTRRRRTAAML